MSSKVHGVVLVVASKPQEKGTGICFTQFELDERQVSKMSCPFYRSQIGECSVGSKCWIHGRGQGHRSAQECNLDDKCWIHGRRVYRGSRHQPSCRRDEADANEKELEEEFSEEQRQEPRYKRGGRGGRWRRSPSPEEESESESEEKEEKRGERQFSKQGRGGISLVRSVHRDDNKKAPSSRSYRRSDRQDEEKSPSRVSPNRRSPVRERQDDDGEEASSKLNLLSRSGRSRINEEEKSSPIEGRNKKDKNVYLSRVLQSQTERVMRE